MVAPLVIAILLLATPVGVDVLAGDSINADQPILHALEKLGERMSLRSQLHRARERLAELDKVKKPEAVTNTIAELDAVAEELPAEEKQQALTKRTEVLNRVLASAPEQAKPGLLRALEAPRGRYGG